MRHGVEDGYREKLQALLARGHVRRLRAEWLLARARRRSQRQGIALDRSLAETYERVRDAVDHRVGPGAGSATEAGPALGSVVRSTSEAPEPVHFLCDSSLGGLARWIRASGYRADAASGRAGGLIDQAGERVLLTSDHRLLERRAARQGPPHVVWVPSRLGVLDQLRMVLGDLGLAPREPLCMACGGDLQPVAKHDVADRIPPRTALWKDDYFVCSGCGKLFWHGTHWDRIRQRLAQATSRNAP